MVSDDEQYAFADYLRESLEGGHSRDTVEWEWHREKEAPDKRTYDPDESKIDFYGKTYKELKDSE